MNQKWDERYKDLEFAYGKDPNMFFKEWLPKFQTGSILMPADGEGRNGVFAAELGWEVTSFDLSVEGQSKALQLAKEGGVTVEYIVADLEQLRFERETFDAIGLVYAHRITKTLWPPDLYLSKFPFRQYLFNGNLFFSSYKPDHRTLSEMIFSFI